jgi:hypothetical protein
MQESGVLNHCCDEHGNAYIRARERSRESGAIFCTPEETRCLNRITSHLIELRSGRQDNISR